MGRNNYFQFKQFKIVQEKAAMKVGTDGVLLGAWVEVSNVQSVLEIGTGTGVIALMLAQRSLAKITGIEIEKNAAEEAAENASRSRWAERINIKHISFQNFMKNNQCQFDLVISNPPFFINARRSANSNLAIAKHSDLLTLNELAEGAEKLLKTNGKLALILPVSTAEKFISLAEFPGLYLSRLAEVKPNNLKKTHRYLMEFTRQPGKTKTELFSIQKNDGSDFSEQYKSLTGDFYLNF